jgi:hypothetical protein
MNKETPMQSRIFFIVRHLIKAIIYVLLLSVLGMSCVITTGIDPFLQGMYGMVALVCLGAFGISYRAKYRKMAYWIFGCALTVFVLMSEYVPEIKEQLDIDRCLDGGMVYDPVQKICRTDCLTWDDVRGCIKDDGPTSEPQE